MKTSYLAIILIVVIVLVIGAVLLVTPPSGGKSLTQADIDATAIAGAKGANP